MDRIIYASLTGKQIAKNVLASQTEKPENMQYGDSIAYFQDNSNVEFFLDVPWFDSSDSVILRCCIDSELFRRTDDVSTVLPEHVSIVGIVADFRNFMLFPDNNNEHIIELVNFTESSKNDKIYVEDECLISVNGKSYKQELNEIIKYVGKRN